VKRRVLLHFMPFGTLALMEQAQAAIKLIATEPAAAPLSAATSAVAAPFILANQLVQGLLTLHFQPRAEAFQVAAQALASALAPDHSGTRWAQHRPLWVKAMLAWEQLAAVAVGPLLERRSVRAIDFWPTRPTQIRATLARGLGALDSVQSLDAVGATARGLPALEWLLWKTDGSASIRPYAHLLARQLEAESHALVAGYQALNDPERDDADAWVLYGEWFGQAVGGLDQLRAKKMSIETRGKDSSVWVRGVSGQTAAAWLAEAQGLQAFLVGSQAAQAATPLATRGWPVPGSLNSLLLGRGHLQDSRNLLEQTNSLLIAVARAQPQHDAQVRNAQAALARLSSLMGRIAVEVLHISLGFTDADGD
jgi:predicted lipoprotein